MKRLYLSLPLVLLLVGCATSKPGSSQEQSSSSSQGGGASGNTKTFDFDKAPFTGTGGVKLLDKKTEFLDYLNTDGNYVSSITVDDCVYFQPIYNEDGTQNGLTLCVGTASAGGSISFTFTENIKSISFTLQAYHKYYSSAFHADDNSALTIEGHNYVLDTSLTNKGMPPMLEDTIQLSPSKQTITFSNDGDHQRSFVHNLTIEY